MAPFVFMDVGLVVLKWSVYMCKWFYYNSKWCGGIRLKVCFGVWWGERDFCICRGRRPRRPMGNNNIHANIPSIIVGDPYLDVPWKTLGLCEHKLLE